VILGKRVDLALARTLDDDWPDMFIPARRVWFKPDAIDVSTVCHPASWEPGESAATIKGYRIDRDGRVTDERVGVPFIVEDHLPVWAAALIATARTETREWTP
jgi:hypothetical protein